MCAEIWLIRLIHASHKSLLLLGCPVQEAQFCFNARGLPEFSRMCKVFMELPRKVGELTKTLHQLLLTAPGVTMEAIGCFSRSCQ